MAEAASHSEQQAEKPPPKRRRILDPSAIVPVPVYSNKVSSSLQLKPAAVVFTEKENTDDGVDESLWSRFSSQGPTAAVIALSDSEEDEAEQVEKKAGEHLERKTEPEAIRSPSPPPPQSPVQKPSRRVKKKISEFDRKLRAVNYLLTPEPQDSRSRCHLGLPIPDYNNDDDDVIIMSANSGLQDSLYSSSVREIPLKIRCRTDVHKIPVLSSTPLGDVVTQLSVILKVPPARLLLLREDMELPTDSTVSELGLGIADIIECVVMAAEHVRKPDGGGGLGLVTVRLQSKDRDSSQEFSLHRDAPLGSVFSQYLSKVSAGAQTQVRFLFDGSKVAHGQTPAELDMEDGDIIEVWI